MYVCIYASKHNYRNYKSEDELKEYKKSWGDGETWNGHDANAVFMYELIKNTLKIVFHSGRF